MIEAHDHTVPTHETSVTLTPALRAMYRLDTDPGEDLCIGWELGHGGYVFDPQLLDADTIIGIAARVHLLLSTGRPA